MAPTAGAHPLKRTAGTETWAEANPTMRETRRTRRKTRRKTGKREEEGHPVNRLKGQGPGTPAATHSGAARAPRPTVGVSLLCQCESLPDAHETLSLDRILSLKKTRTEGDHCIPRDTPIPQGGRWHPGPLPAASAAFPGQPCPLHLRVCLQETGAGAQTGGCPGPEGGDTAQGEGASLWLAYLVGGLMREGRGRGWSGAAQAPVRAAQGHSEGVFQVREHCLSFPTFS